MIKKLQKWSYFYPMGVFLLTVGFGLLKIDVGDSSSHISYGWMYFIFGTWIVMALYLWAYVTLGFFLKGLKKQKIKTNHTYLLSTRLLTIISGLILVSNFFSILVGLYSIQTYAGLTFILGVLALGINGWLLTHQSEVASKSSPSQMKQWLPTLLSLVIVFLPASIWFGSDQVINARDKETYLALIQKSYEDRGHTYQIEIIEHRKISDERVRVTYYLEEGDNKIPVAATFDFSEGPATEPYQTTYVDAASSFRRLGMIQVNSPEGDELLTTYGQQVQKAIDKLNLSDYLIVSEKTPNQYDGSHFSIITIPWKEFPENLKIKMKEGLASTDKKQQAFEGWGNLSLDDLVSARVLFPEIQVSFDWDKNHNIEYAEKEQIYDEGFAKLLDHLDASDLIDGNYFLTKVPNEWLFFEVTEGKIKGEVAIPSRSLVGLLSDSNFSMSSDFIPW